MYIPKKVAERIVAGIKRMVPILIQQKARDVSEADTVTLVKDLLSEVFGYDKYAELTGEMAIRGSYCDLAIRLEGKITSIIEVKAIGIGLEDRHVRQAVDYGANQGVEWVMLTNAIVWRLYHVLFEKPIDKQLVLEIDLTQVDVRKEADLELLYTLTKEGFQKGLHVALRDKQDATSRFLIAALLLGNETVVGMVRRELRRVVDVNVSVEDVAKVLRDEVIKRECLEGPPADSAASRVRQMQAKMIREQAKTKALSPTNADVPTPEAEEAPAAAEDGTGQA